MTTLACPNCDGTGSRQVLARLSSGTCEWRDLRCQDCEGTGRITAERQAILDAAESFRKARIARDEGLDEAAARMGITRVQRSDMEHGRLPIPEGAI